MFILRLCGWVVFLDGGFVNGDWRRGARSEVVEGYFCVLWISRKGER